MDLEEQPTSQPTTAGGSGADLAPFCGTRGKRAVPGGKASGIQMLDPSCK